MADTPDEDARRRRTALIWLVVVALLFLTILVSVALGQAIVAAVASGLLIAAWFATRSMTRR